MEQEENLNYSTKSYSFFITKNFFNLFGFKNSNSQIKINMKKYSEQITNNKFKKIPLIYTNPIWDQVNKKLIWNEFDTEIKNSLRKPIGTTQTIYALYNYWTWKQNLINKKKYKFVFDKKPIFNYFTKRIEWK